MDEVMSLVFELIPTSVFPNRPHNRRDSIVDEEEVVSALAAAEI
jgi:hypothetical protein